jgi:hypothetical protein
MRSLEEGGDGGGMGGKEALLKDRNSVSAPINLNEFR